MQKSLKYHRSFAKIDLTAIKENFIALKGCISDGTKTMAIVKANAYGHGAVRVAKLLENMADYFAVADIQEALELRENGIKNPILILSYTSSYHYEELVANNIISTIYSLEDARKLSQLAVEMNKNAVVHIAVDTGMNRIGFKDTDESADIIKRISELSNVVIDGVFTHFASADCKDKTFMHIQQKRFADFLEKLESRGVDIPLKHCCNSAAIIDSDCHYDMVRMGIALYGMFIAIVIPPAKKQRNVMWTVVFAIILSLVFNFVPILSGISSGWATIIITVAVSALAATLFPIITVPKSAEEGENSEI